MEVYLDDLEQQFMRLSIQINDRACATVDNLQSSFSIRSVNNYTEKSAIRKMENINNQWKRLKMLSKTLDCHLEHSKNYHMLYQSVLEYRQAISVASRRQIQLLRGESSTGIQQEGTRLYEVTANFLAYYLKWWQKIDSLYVQSKKICPLQLRRGEVDIKRPAKMLLDYETDQVILHNNEDIFIIDNADRYYWLVETVHGNKCRVPSIYCALTPPDTQAVEQLNNLSAYLFSDWTSSLKEIASVITNYLLTIFQGSESLQMSTLTEFDINNRREILNLLNVIADFLDFNSASTQHKAGYDALRERLRISQTTLSLYEKDDEIDDITKIDINSIFLQISPLVLDHESTNLDLTTSQKRLTSCLILKYQELLRHWEKFKSKQEQCADINLVSLKSFVYGPDAHSNLKRESNFDNQFDLSSHLGLLNRDPLRSRSVNYGKNGPHFLSNFSNSPKVQTSKPTLQSLNTAISKDIFEEISHHDSVDEMFEDLLSDCNRLARSASVRISPSDSRSRTSLRQDTTTLTTNLSGRKTTGNDNLSVVGLSLENTASSSFPRSTNIRKVIRRKQSDDCGIVKLQRSVASRNNISASSDGLSETYIVEAVWDAFSQEYCDFPAAKSRELIDNRSAKVLIDPTPIYIDFIDAVERGYVKAKKQSFSDKVGESLPASRVIIVKD